MCSLSVVRLRAYVPQPVLSLSIAIVLSFGFLTTPVQVLYDSCRRSGSHGLVRLGFVASKCQDGMNLFIAGASELFCIKLNGWVPRPRKFDGRELQISPFEIVNQAITIEKPCTPYFNISVGPCLSRQYSLFSSNLPCV